MKKAKWKERVLEGVVMMKMNMNGSFKYGEKYKEWKNKKVNGRDK